MAAKKSKTPEKKIFTDSNFPVKRIYQKSTKKDQMRMQENIHSLEEFILECTVSDFGLCDNILDLEMQN